MILFNREHGEQSKDKFELRGDIMNQTEKRLLTLILTETARIEGLPQTWLPGISRAEWAAIAIPRADLKSIGVRISGEWIGNGNADRQARRRGLISLENKDFVELFAAHGRITTHVHVRLTEAGCLAAGGVSLGE